MVPELFGGRLLFYNHLGFLMIEFRSHRLHDLTETFQILTHVLKLDPLLLIQKLLKTQN